jgi:hypothetical protein
VRELKATEGVDMNLESGARHESGHIVIAASQGLRLRPEGLMVDSYGWGLACYHDAPEENDGARERNILAVMAGFAVEKRFREQRGYPARDSMDIALNQDNQVARRLLRNLAGEYFLNETRLKQQLQELIERHSLAIETLATAVLAKDWETLRPLGSGGRWAHEEEVTAKYVSGEEAVAILALHEIAATSGPG